MVGRRLGTGAGGDTEAELWSSVPALVIGLVFPLPVGLALGGGGVGTGAGGGGADAGSGDPGRRSFHEKGDRRVAGLDLPGVLRAFGIAVAGGSSPNPAAVRKGYREAVLRYHPDRQREASLQEKVEAEEAFKIITARMESFHS